MRMACKLDPPTNDIAQEYNSYYKAILHVNDGALVHANAKPISHDDTIEQIALSRGAHIWSAHMIYIICSFTSVHPIAHRRGDDFFGLVSSTSRF
jgi:hypothetical protein